GMHEPDHRRAIVADPDRPAPASGEPQPWEALVKSARCGAAVKVDLEDLAPRHLAGCVASLDVADGEGAIEAFDAGKAAAIHRPFARLGVSPARRRPLPQQIGEGLAVPHALSGSCARRLALLPLLPTDGSPRGFASEVAA